MAIEKEVVEHRKCPDHKAGAEGNHENEHSFSSSI
jgi:hypothetical protein